MLPITNEITDMKLKNLSFPMIRKKKLSHYNRWYDTYKYKLRDKKYNTEVFEPFKVCTSIFFNDFGEYWFQDKLCKYKRSILTSSRFKPKLITYRQRMSKIYLVEFRKIRGVRINDTT